MTNDQTHKKDDSIRIVWFCRYCQREHIAWKSKSRQLKETVKANHTAVQNNKAKYPS